MMRARDAFAAILVGVLGVGGLSISAQTQSTPPPAQPPAPDLKPVLAGKKFSPPIKGEANIDFVKTPTSAKARRSSPRFR